MSNRGVNTQVGVVDNLHATVFKAAGAQLRIPELRKLPTDTDDTLLGDPSPMCPPA
jgi:hypothetical protein